MKKIFLCIPTLSNAGAQRFVTELACGLNKDVYTPIVVVTNKLDAEAPFYCKLVESRIQVEDVSDTSYIKETKKIINLIKKEKPDLVHSNVGAVLHMFLPMILSRTKVNHLFTVHSMGWRIFSGIKKSIIKLGFKTKKIVPVAICETVKKSIVDAYGIKTEFVEMVYNGVDTRWFTPYGDACKQRIFSFVTTGRLEKVKNHRLLIEAFHKFHLKYSNTCLKLVGDGELRNSLEQLVAELNIKDAIVFEGNQSDVGKYLNNADVYCCSSFVEGLPIAVLEAMACGLPIITTSAGGVVDIVENNKNGYVVDSDVSKICECMERLYLNTDLRNRMGEASRERAEELDLSVCAKNYEYLYEKYIAC